jgi:hypothetical protein
MKYKSTAEYRQQHQILKDEYKKIDVLKDELQRTLWGKLKLLCSKYPEAQVTNVYSPPRPEDYFSAKILTKKPRRWNPNFHYAGAYASEYLLRYIEQIEKYAEKQ